MLSIRKTVLTAATLLIATLAVVATLQPRNAAARVRLENICSIYGQKEVKLTGLGLIVGLNGTGDGGKNMPSMRALSQVLQHMNLPTHDLRELSNADNVAVVLLEATIPKTGLRSGQTVDCHVSSIMGADSLRGGRLMVAPLQTAEIGNDTVVALASGAIVIEDNASPTTGLLPDGATLQAGFVSSFVDQERGNVITLLLDESHSSFHAASEVARVINDDFSFETSQEWRQPSLTDEDPNKPLESLSADNRRIKTVGERIAKAVSPGVVEVNIPEHYQNPEKYHQTPVDFVAQVLSVGIDNPHTQARILVNPKTGTVIVTGEVEISPVVISHKNLTIRVGNANIPGQAQAADSFVSVAQQGQQPTQQLQQLVEALNQVQVPNEDIIDIIRELHRSGKLHAMYVEH